ncbi:hypothetical protein H257_05918 [Aphanomyces astaci]|uniref:Uncharacterized protein n=1 Tax=Aphanomyces astaci TaxID=112090 RepID=W4GNU2_APHAT|nr:hypothetical protein H257_05918 [Aphanomyces astaci]ETV81382.1 hypothetical protein H257_05918 [Aphanomyces astaci]|eukprot:XP_009829240.1 hypothetical protein H257_05918 [Aphanomyces astaci]
MHHNTEVVNAVRRERGWNASPDVASKRVLLMDDQSGRPAAYRAMKKASRAVSQGSCPLADLDSKPTTSRSGTRARPPLEAASQQNPSTAANSQRVVATHRMMERHVVVQEHEARVVQLARLDLLPLDHKLAWNASPTSP